MTPNRYKTFTMAIVVAVVCLAGPFANAEINVPVPSTHVADRAGLFDAGTAAHLDGWLTELEQKTGAQVIVLTVDTTEGEDVHGFSLRHAESWKLGQKGKDNGALIAVAVQDRKYFIQVGYGLEGVLPDAFCATVGRRFFVPNFRKGNYAGGLVGGTVAIANQIADDAGVQISGIPSYRAPTSTRGAGGMGGFFTLLFAVAIITSVFRSRKRGRGYWGTGGFWQMMLLGSLLGGPSGRRGSWGGGGFGGGSFGGGGGGMFGGGGAGGSW